MDKPTVVSWSGGKDSALALHELTRNTRYGECRLHGLLTTMTSGYDRISGHGVHVGLLHAQAERLGIELFKAYIPTQSTMADYESAMASAYRQRRAAGVDSVTFGDIFLKGPKKAHLGALQDVDMLGVFPLWHRRSLETVRTAIELGFRALTVCVDSSLLDGSFLGRVVDDTFLSELPSGIDPAGENGEYHTFVVDGPMWSWPVEYTIAGTVARGGLLYCDVRSAGAR